MENQVLTRTPRKFFITSGVGESDIDVHTGSFHLALFDAKICDFNIMYYSSIIPKDAIETEKPDNIPFGSVLETISAQISGIKGQKVFAGISFGDLVNKKSGEKIGSIVVERTTKISQEELEKNLSDSLLNLHQQTYSECSLENIRTIQRDLIITKDFGTVFVGICFYSFVIKNA